MRNSVPTGSPVAMPSIFIEQIAPQTITEMPLCNLVLEVTKSASFNYVQTLFGYMDWICLKDKQNSRMMRPSEQITYSTLNYILRQSNMYT